jgi:hypothetical protein
MLNKLGLYLAAEYHSRSIGFSGKSIIRPMQRPNDSQTPKQGIHGRDVLRVAHGIAGGS